MLLSPGNKSSFRAGFVDEEGEVLEVERAGVPRQGGIPSIPPLVRFRFLTSPIQIVHFADTFVHRHGQKIPARLAVWADE
jgi:hypothetical protein